MNGAQIVWSANRNHPVQENATVQFTEDGDLILRDFDGSLVWSTGTKGISVTGMTLLESGNLALFNSNNSYVWQSFDHPTNTLVLGQTLGQLERITADASEASSEPGLFYLTIVGNIMSAFAGHNSPIIYYSSSEILEKSDTKFPNNITYTNGGIKFSDNWTAISLPMGNTTQFIRLEYNGHLRLYQWGPIREKYGWSSTEILSLHNCDYPMSSGKYGVCTKGGQCSCPFENDSHTSYFLMINDLQADHGTGCSPVIPLSCEAEKYHKLLTLNNVTYYNFSSYSFPTDEESCKQACLENCSCEVAFFDRSISSCYISTEVLSISASESDLYYNNYNLSAFIKVQNGSSSRGSITWKVVGPAIGCLFLLILTIGFAVLRKIKKKENKLEEEDILPLLSEIPKRFSLAELKLATQDFSTKLGSGGFGSVFEGNIEQKKVAVKRLDSLSQGKDEFLAEVQIIGGIHHINLVRLVGYCAENSERLLVYEYMPNGSLDKWIFDKRQSAFLDWNIRRALVTDVAKGLLYLHEDCRQIIAHFDIKPQNILIDDNLNAKISDFGLAKLIDRDQSHVITRMRGTPGYLAPEWLTNVITEKADIYSFGIVVIEILCGRRNLDHKQQEENVHLISLLRDKIRTNKLPEIIDSNIAFVESHLEDIIRMVKLAMWCLESDSTRRPTMPVVVKILEGAMDFEADLEKHFFNVTPVEPQSIDVPTIFSGPPLESLLSGPR
ncbi:G-type lectin S-receptor-like serine/threonine-protein kinase SD2-5 [Carex rostrata]